MSSRILLVDDNRDACDVLSRVLSTKGYQVDSAYDGPSALELVEQNPYGLAVIDYSMPGMDGVELYQRIHQMHPEVVGVFLTGYATIDTVFPAIGAGITRVLAKPVDFKEFLPLVEELVGRPRANSPGDGAAV